MHERDCAQCFRLEALLALQCQRTVGRHRPHGHAVWGTHAARADLQILESQTQPRIQLQLAASTSTGATNMCPECCWFCSTFSSSLDDPFYFLAVICIDDARSYLQIAYKSPNVLARGPPVTWSLKTCGSIAHRQGLRND